MRCYTSILPLIKKTCLNKILMFVGIFFRLGITVIHKLQNTNYHYPEIVALASVPAPNLINLPTCNSADFYETKTENL